jgi:hypothetical protein
MRDRQCWVVLLVAALVVLPRGYLISAAQSERIDDEYHLIRGIAFLKRQLPAQGSLELNDPPLGEAISAMPNMVAGCVPEDLSRGSALYGLRLGPDTLLNLIGLWKSLLYLPVVVLAFVWTRQLYNLAAGWAAALLMLFEPTLAAHTPLPTLDVAATEAILFSCYLAWRYARSPSTGRLMMMSFAVAVALCIKHTAIILPIVCVAYAVLWRVFRPAQLPAGQLRSRWRYLMAHAVAAAPIVCASIWLLMLLDVGRPRIPQRFLESHAMLSRLLDRPMPAGIYMSSLLEGFAHADKGHVAYLFGKISKSGWWYYFPAVAIYKVPLGIAALMLGAMLSLTKARLRFDELSLLIPCAAWSLFVMFAPIDIGWRHFLPAYVFAMLFACRALLLPGHAWMIAAFGAIAACAIHATAFHPDYLCYINFPRHKPYLAISDSNVDWGQALKQTRAWILANARNRQVTVRDMGWTDLRQMEVQHRLGDVARMIARNQAVLPTHGLFIVSPVAEAGVYERADLYRALRGRQAVAVIGHCMRVYDLDQLSNGRGFKWPLPKVSPPSATPSSDTPSLTPTSRPSSQ